MDRQIEGVDVHIEGVDVQGGEREGGEYIPCF